MKRPSKNSRRLPLAGARTVLLATLGLLGAQQVALAQMNPQELPAKESVDASRWGIGLGVGVGREAYRDFDNDVQALPLLMYENRHISFVGTTFDVKLPSAGPVSLRLRAKYDGDGYEAKDSPFLAGMDERKGGLWLGGGAIWRTDVVNVSAEALTSTGDAEGKRAKLELNRTFKSGNFSLTPRIAANWYDKKYVEYYYGVKASEVRAGRAAYKGDATTAFELGLRLGYSINEHHNVFVDVSGTSLGSEIKDSPLVDRSSKIGARLGYLYSF